MFKGRCLGYSSAGVGKDVRVRVKKRAGWGCKRSGAVAEEGGVVQKKKKDVMRIKTLVVAVETNKNFSTKNGSSLS